VQRKDRIVVESFDCAQGFLDLLIQLLPPVLRKIIYRITFKEFGKDNYIGPKCFFRYPWKILVGSNSSIGRGCQIYPSFQNKDAYVTIGSDVLIGPNLCIYGAGHPVESPIDKHIGESVSIGDGVYIGGNVLIRYGVTIGANSIVAMGSVVVSNVEPFSVYGGNPAKLLKRTA